MMTALLKVQAVTTGRGMHQQKVHKAVIPRIFVLGTLIHPDTESCRFQGLLKPLKVMPEEITDYRVLTVKLFHGFHECLQLAIMNRDGILIFVVHGTRT